MSDVSALVTLRECMTFVHTWMNVLLQTDMGKKSVLSPVACGILYVAYFHEIKMKDVSERFQISKSTATDYINNLEKRGFVKRVRGEEDRRDIYIIPDRAGERWILERETDVFSFLKKRLSVLDKSEQETFVRLLAKFTGYGDGSEHEKSLFEIVGEAKVPCGEICMEENERFERVEMMVKRVYGNCSREKSGDEI